MPLLAYEVSQWLIGLMVVFFLFISVCMMLIVLIQRPQGGGIAGAFGGGGAEGAGQTAFGAKTGDVLTTVTIGIFVVFLGSAIALNFLVRPPKIVAESAVVAAPEKPGPSSAPATGTPVTAAPTTPTPAPIAPEKPGADGKFHAESDHGSIQSIVPVEIIPAGQPLPEGVKPLPIPAPTPAPAPAGGQPATNPPATSPSTPPASPPANPK